MTRMLIDFHHVLNECGLVIPDTGQNLLVAPSLQVSGMESCSVGGGGSVVSMRSTPTIGLHSCACVRVSGGFPCQLTELSLPSIPSSISPPRAKWTRRSHHERRPRTRRASGTARLHPSSPSIGQRAGGGQPASTWPLLPLGITGRCWKTSWRRRAPNFYVNCVARAAAADVDAST